MIVAAGVVDPPPPPLPMLNVTVDCAEPEVAPVAVTVKVPDPELVGVPEITPVEELIESPAGRFAAA